MIIFGGFGVVPRHHTWGAVGMARGNIAPSSLSGEKKGGGHTLKVLVGMARDFIPPGGGKGLI